jgi:uncharacterized protein YjbJ (UPF0337 family)
MGAETPRSSAVPLELARYNSCSSPQREDDMNQDELKGKMDQLKGKAKQAAGDLTDNEELHSEGKADEMQGSVQEGFGKTRRKVGEAIEDLGDNLKR